MDSGKLFERDFKQSCVSKGVWVHRITDNVYHTKYGVRSSKTPADFIVVTNRQSWLVECKAVKGQSLPFARVEEHQEQSLLEFSKQKSGCGVLAINMYGDRRKCNQLFLLDIKKYLAYKKKCGRKSIPISYLKENAIECKRVGKYWEIPVEKI